MTTSRLSDNCTFGSDPIDQYIVRVQRDLHLRSVSHSEDLQ